MVVAVGERNKAKVKEPKFIDPEKLTREQLTDPDYSLKKIARDAGISETEMIVCSKCHYCR